MPPKLHAVRPDEPARGTKPAPRRHLTLAEAVESGDHYAILVAQRRQIVSDLGGAEGPAKAALHRQLALLSKDIAAIDAAKVDNEVGQAAATPDDTWDDSAI